jgi:hypothetical protein
MPDLTRRIGGDFLQWGGGRYHVRHPAAAGGATGDGVTDETEQLNAAFDAVRLSGSPGVVALEPNRTYRAFDLRLWPGITLELNGSRILGPDGWVQANAYWRMLTVKNASGALWRGDEDSAPLILRGGTIDGNLAGQTPDYLGRNYLSYEHNHILALHSDTASPLPGRLVVKLEDMVIRGAVGDGCLVYTGVDYEERGVRYHDCKRGGLQIGGGYTKAKITSFEGTSNLHPTGFRSEVDGAGYGGDTGIQMVIDGMLTDYFQVGVLAGSDVRASNVNLRRPYFNVSAMSGSFVRLMNSKFRFPSTATGSSLFAYPGDCTLQNCDLIADRGLAPGAPAGEFRAVNLLWNSSSSFQRQRLRLLDCNWLVADNILPADTLVAAHILGDALAYDNRLIVEGGSIDPRYNFGIRQDPGTRVAVRGTRIGARTAFTTTGSLGSGLSHLEIDSPIVEATVQNYLSADLGDPGSVLRHRNTELDEEVAQHATTFGIHASNLSGGRLILANSSPMGRLSGLVGDRARLKVPVAGQPYEWVCTASGVGAAATWRQVSAVAS